MKKILYYVVEKQLQDNGDCEETNGLKDVTIYEMVDNKPKKFADLELDNSDNTITAIKDYLDENGHGDEDFELIQL